MRFSSFLFLVLLMGGLIYSSSISLDLPAVSSESLGNLVTINITSMDGTGKIYFSNPPYIGISYQKSFKNALTFIDSQHPNFTRENDFYIIFSDESTSSVEGASGGVATAVILKSLYENKNVDENIVVTGEIDSLGNTLPVGGIPEKLVASYFNNKSMLLVPSSISNNEKIISAKLSKEFEFPIYEYDDFYGVYFVYTESNLEGVNNVHLDEQDFSNVLSLNEVEENVFFSGTVSDMFNSYNKELIYIMHLYPDFMPYFDSIYRGSLNLFEKGYTYSAGNEIFLALESVSLLTSSYSDEEFKIKLNEINNCLDETKVNLESYEGSLEYFIASEVRFVKAKDTIDSYMNESENPSIRFYTSSIFTRSNLWCQSALDNSKNSEFGDYNEEKLIEFIEFKLIKYSGNVSSHLTEARKYYSRGYYGASLNEIITYEGKIYDCENLEFDYEWSKMMYNHAIYLNSSTRFGDNSYTEISNFACAYERNLKQYNALDFKIEKKENEIYNPFYVMCVILIFILFTLSIIYYVLKRGK